MTRITAFERRIVSWYAGIHAEQAAEAEGCPVGDVRGARARLGRGTEYGLRRADGADARPESDEQLSLALARIMSTPPERS